MAVFAFQQKGRRTVKVFFVFYFVSCYEMARAGELKDACISGTNSEASRPCGSRQRPRLKNTSELRLPPRRPSDVFLSEGPHVNSFLFDFAVFWFRRSRFKGIMVQVCYNVTVSWFTLIVDSINRWYLAPVENELRSPGPATFTNSVGWKTTWKPAMPGTVLF